MRRPKSLPDAVMAEIQRVLVERGLKVGERLPSERELAQQLSVGRSSLREAMQGLQTMGLIEVRHGVGTFFIGESGKWLLSPLTLYETPPRRLFAELIEARLMVEVRLAALAAERATQEDIVKLREAAAKRARARRGQYVERGLEFHLAVAAAARHTVLASMLKAVVHLYFDVLDSLDPAARDVEAAFRARQQGGHDEIVRMIEARDPQGAADAMRAHLWDLQAEFPSINEPSMTADNERELAK
jgi:GntR family transcriptional regulator, transcriptional repressor for pyruvate dehydrogenase complex